ncbi:DUF3828 domain-containing protein [Aquamicrobium soli]|jgi:hypothetical protein|uniref:DUF3828 domain-containing protein n=1 Tax=Aquamicrobium soli TaxID=1811518 RepID=A0ABV7K6H5_9HYPH
MKSLLLLAALCASMPVAAVAGPAADAVRFFYTPEVRFEADSDYRDRFTEPVTKLFELNDAAITKNPDQLACIDFDPGLDAQDFDQSTLNKTLKLSEQVNGDSAQVTATFRLFADDDDSDREMLWSLKKVGGDWKIADIASRTHNWRLSELGCMAGDDAD